MLVARMRYRQVCQGMLSVYKKITPEYIVLVLWKPATGLPKSVCNLNAAVHAYMCGMTLFPVVKYFTVLLSSVLQQASYVTCSKLHIMCESLCPGAKGIYLNTGNQPLIVRACKHVQVALLDH